MFSFNVGYYSLVKVCPPPSECMERALYVLAHKHCSLFVDLADFDHLTGIYCAADHIQLKGG